MRLREWYRRSGNLQILVIHDHRFGNRRAIDAFFSIVTFVHSRIRSTLGAISPNIGIAISTVVKIDLNVHHMGAPLNGVWITIGRHLCIVRLARRILTQYVRVNTQRWNTSLVAGLVKLVEVTLPPSFIQS
jgi:hypothetical protein